MARGYCLERICAWCVKAKDQIMNRIRMTASMALLLAATATQADWPMFRGNPGLTGVSDAKLPNQLALLWKYKVGEPVKSSAAIVDGRVFVGGDDGQMHCINLTTGKKIWTYVTQKKNPDPVEASPTVLNGRVFFGGLDGKVLALDAKTGGKLWEFETDDQIVGGANWVKAPNGKDDWIIVGSWDYNLYALDAKTGKKQWIFECQERINGTPAVVKGRTLFGGCDAMVHVIHLAKGKEEKAVESTDPIAASAAAEGDHVYVGSMGSQFLCFDMKAGKMLWKYEDRPFNYESSPALTKNRVLFGGQDKRLHCLNRADGALQWVFNTKGQVNSSPVVCGNRVLFGSNDGKVYMVSLDLGKRIWEFETEDSITASPAVANGKVVIGSEDGFVYCFGPKK
tara:strand:- start:44 stop:1231 length:1188 start_codon:yes stop_codon:yes gene_type:complete